ncbi:MAG: ATP-grasp domain-containing protein [Candidatus Helarchaeota archaeon]
MALFKKSEVWLFGTKTYEMQRICEELSELKVPYRIVKWDELTLPLKSYPSYAMILYLDIMHYHDDLIYGLCVLEELTRAHVRILPSLKGFYNSDKFTNYLLWHRYLKNSIQMPDTLCTINLKNGVSFLKKYHSRVLFKPISGSQGIGIEVVESETRLTEIFEHYHVLFLQQIIEDRGYDLRTLVIGNNFKIQYARYNPHRLRKNIHLGASPKALSEIRTLDPAIDRFALQSQKIAMNIKNFAELDLVGVDTLPARDGTLYLLEWNSLPGFHGAELATNVNIGKEFVKILLETTPNI